MLFLAIWFGSIKFSLYLCTQNKKHSNMASTKLRIKEICRAQGITQAQLAERLGILPVSFNQALMRNNFSLTSLGKIADALNVRVVDLFDTGVNMTCPHCGGKIQVAINVVAK